MIDKDPKPSPHDLPSLEGPICDLSFGGDGILKVPQGPVVFVPRTAPGDLVRVQILQEKKRYSRGELISLLSPSTLRTPPFCPHYEQCGGCHLQHINNTEVWRFKQQQIEQTLLRIGKISAPVSEMRCLSPDRAYRNKLSYQVKEAKLGYTHRSTYDFLPIQDCPIALPQLNQVKRDIESFLSHETLASLRYVTLRASTENLISLVLAFVSPPSQVQLKSLSHWIEEKALAACYYTLIPADKPIALGKAFFKIAGKEDLSEKINGLEYTVKPYDFFQVNPQMAQLLAQEIIDQAQHHQFSKTLDLYCGAGFFGLQLARHHIQSLGVEANYSSICQANENARRNGLEDYAKFRAGKASTILKRLRSEQHRFDSAVLDPPRQGLDPLSLTELCAMHIDRLIYVSCNPATFARDALQLSSKGYQLQSVTPFDMFPYTYHVELMAYFSR